MNMATLSSNWALILAVVPALIAIVLISRFLISRTASGQLRSVLKGYRSAQKELSVAQKMSKKTAARLEKLVSKAGKTVPRVLQESKEAAEDAKLLQKNAHDRVLVAANHVRRVIHEEFPPASQQKLRSKYLPQDGNDGNQ